MMNGTGYEQMNMHSKNKSTQNLNFFGWSNHIIRFSLLEKNFEHLLLKSIKMIQLEVIHYFQETVRYALYMQRMSPSIPDVSLAGIHDALLFMSQCALS